jgi:hypothetical protein
MTLTITERVAAGAAYLDEHHPGWVERIDLSKLNLGECGHCVLGQLFGDFWDAPVFGESANPYTEEEFQSVFGLARPLGFAAPKGDDSDASYAALTAEWKRLIEERRAVTPC